MKKGKFYGLSSVTVSNHIVGLYNVNVSDINRRYANAAARVIQARWRLYKARSAGCGLCTKFEQYNTLNILSVRFNNAWMNWRSISENKRIVDGLFYTEFLTDRPEIVRHDILNLSENIADFFGKKSPTTCS